MLLGYRKGRCGRFSRWLFLGCLRFWCRLF
jgi:hypothetical protein